jgi:hypothetical protein
MSPISIPGKVTLARHDSDVVNYIAAVEAADGQSLESGVKLAYHNFIIGCKADGIWDAIKASCILAGARTLAGALVPLKGTAPTNYNFVAGDYDRETGLVGDGSTKYLDSNRNNNAEPQDSQHVVVSLTQQPTINFTLAGTGINSGGVTGLFSSPLGGGNYEFQSRSRNNNVSSGGFPSLAGTLGISRSASSSYSEISNAVIRSFTKISLTPLAGNIFVFGRNNSGSLNNPVNARLSFYSIGESLDLALLDARVTTLMTDIGAAIP